MWIRSSRCDSSACVAVSPSVSSVWVADSTSFPTCSVEILSVPHADWRRFVGEIRAGGLDR